MKLFYVNIEYSSLTQNREWPFSYSPKEPREDDLNLFYAPLIAPSQPFQSAFYDF